MTLDQLRELNEILDYVKKSYKQLAKYLDVNNNMSLTAQH
jgi:hypothetical protein